MADDDSGNESTMDTGVTTTTAAPVIGGFSEELMSQFYRRLFPFELLYEWLSYGDDKYFARREWSCTLPGDIYIRYLSFGDGEALASYVRGLANKPEKLDIGAVFSFPPSDKNKYGTQVVAQEKELVFDIDMDDYASVRKCCTGKTVCKLCWAFIAAAVKLLNTALREQFGFEHLLFVFSGRRGVHCWVADTAARQLSDRGRKAVVRYLSIVTKDDNRISVSRNPHPFLQSVAEEIALPVFESSILTPQQVLQSEESISYVLGFIPDHDVQSALESEWTKRPNQTSEQRWKDLKATVKQEAKKPKSKLASVDPVTSIAFTYTYPRFDTHVTAATNHLLKSPFCVHPGTGKLCVPIDPDECDNFDPALVPTLAELIAEIDRFDETHGRDSDTKEYEKTSIKRYIQFFKRKFLKPLQNSIRAELRAKEQATVSSMF